MKLFKILIPLTLLAFVFSCEQQKLTTNPSVKLTFSTDTVMFDTIFSSVGSLTRSFRVFNNQNKPLEISSIKLAGLKSSQYRLNIDGFPTNETNNVRLEANDSLYIFVEVTIDPKDVNAPFVVEDSVLFETNGNLQWVNLAAWGQDVHLINGEIIETQTWTKGKPYLIYNSMRIDSLHTLTVEAGVRAYFHQDSEFQVFGSLIVNGTVEEPVLFTSDRIDDDYRNVPGKWYGMIFLPGSSGNSIQNAAITNAVFGIQAGMLATPQNNPDIYLENVEISNHSLAGIWANASNITAYNTLVANCGYANFWAANGGSYKFMHCTFANYWSFSGRSTPAVMLTNFTEFDGDNYANDLNITFGNSIIFGTSDTEMQMRINPAYTFNYKFDHCLVKLDPKLDITTDAGFVNCFTDMEPSFIDIENGIFELDTASLVRNIGSKALVEANLARLGFDFYGNNRLTDGLPDLGAFEFTLEETEEEK